MKIFRPNKLTLPLFLLLAALLISACSFSLAEDVTPPPGAEPPQEAQPAVTSVTGPLYPVVAPNSAAGASIFAEKCAPCHGDTGLGDGSRASQLSVPVPALADPQVAHSSTPAEWFLIVTQGNLERFMPPFSSLTDRQRWDVVSYAFSLSHTTAQVEQGQALYEANCARCHGQGGLGDGPEAAGMQARSFKDQEYMAGISDQAIFDTMTLGVSPNMPPFNQLSEDDRWSITSYVRSFTLTANGDLTALVTPEPANATAASGETPSDAQSTQATAQPVIGEVQVETKTSTGASLPEDTVVTLYAFDNMTLAFTTTQSTRQGDMFTFSGIEMPSERAFIASADYMGTTYGSDVAVVSDPSQPLTLSVVASETTTDPSGLIIDRLHMFFDFSTPDKVQVVQLYLMSNPTDKTITAAEPGGTVLTFSLPEGYENLQFQDGVLGERYLEVPGGFADTQSVRAGVTDYQVLVAFDLPYKNKLTIQQSINYTLTSAVVLLPDNGVKLKSDALVDAGSRDVQGTPYRMYTGTPQSAGSKLQIDLSGRPGGRLSIISTSETRNSLLIGLAALGLVLVIAGLWLYLRERRAREEDLQAEEPEEDELDDADSLMDAIIALDDLHKNGQIPEEAYQQRRADLKRRLEEVME
jgi:mono/diheme cytochrome c family protein